MCQTYTIDVEGRVKKILSKVKIPDLSPALGLGDALISGVGGAIEKVTGTFDTSVGLLRATLGGIPFFGATATSEAYDHTKLDEKHYFLVPDLESEQGFSLYVLRCLPVGVPPINDLPKRRLLHMPSEHALPMLQEIVIKDARETAKNESCPSNFISNNLTSLIDEIDNVDGKVFNGVLLLGGLVAFVNPLAGAAVAMKALLPSVGLILSKYGLKFASETATNIDIANQIRKAEKDVKKQFKHASTISVINPLLHHLDANTNLDMWLMEREKFLFQCAETDFSQSDIKRLTDLTRQVISDVRPNDAPSEYLDAVTEIIRSG